MTDIVWFTLFIFCW